MADEQEQLTQRYGEGAALADVASVWDANAMLGALDQLRDTGPEYNGFLANHGPMAVDAMIRLGGKQDVRRWVEMYRLELSPAVRLEGAVTSENWHEHLGAIERLGDWIKYFRDLAAIVEWPSLVSTWWPRLLPGAAASATHGLIRTAHAVRVLVDSDDNESLMLEELATALAYWAARYQTLPGDPHLAGTFDLTEAIARLPLLDANTESAGPGIGGRFGSLFGVDDLPQAMEAWGPPTIDAATFDDLIGAAARVLAARSNDPIAYCHAVTAPAAVRMILPQLPPEHIPATLAASWQMVAAIMVAFNDFAQPIDEPTTAASIPDTSELARNALRHGDAHVIKLTEACIRQFANTGDTTLLIAADRFRGRVRPRW